MADDDWMCLKSPWRGCVECEEKYNLGTDRPKSMGTTNLITERTGGKGHVVMYNPIDKF